MTNAQQLALSVWTDHVREIRAHFSSLRDAAYSRWLNSNMEITTRDSIMGRLRTHEENAMEGERALYRLNLSNPEGWGSAL